MLEISLKPYRMSSLDVCPKQFKMEYEIGAGLSRDLLEQSNAKKLMGRSLSVILDEISGGKNIDASEIRRIVANKLFDMGITFNPKIVQGIVRSLNIWVKEWSFDGVEQGYNRAFEEFHAFEGREIRIDGVIHAFRHLNEDSVEAVLFRTGDRLYTLESLISSYEPIIYALATSKLYDCDRIVITYFTVKEMKETSVEFSRSELDVLGKLLSNHLNIITSAGKNDVITGVHCSYCPRKVVCNDYKQLLMDAFDVKNVNELLSLDLEEMIRHIEAIDIQAGELKDKSKLMKNALIGMFDSKGISSKIIGQYNVVVRSKKATNYDVLKVMEVMSAEDFKGIVGVDNRKMGKHLKHLSDEERMRIMMHCDIRYTPILKIYHLDDYLKSDEKLRELFDI